MLDLSGNPEDWFFHNKAQFSTAIHLITLIQEELLSVDIKVKKNMQKRLVNCMRDTSLLAVQLRRWTWLDMTRNVLKSGKI